MNQWIYFTLTKRWYNSSSFDLIKRINENKNKIKNSCSSEYVSTLKYFKVILELRKYNKIIFIKKIIINHLNLMLIIIYLIIMLMNEEKIIYENGILNDLKYKFNLRYKMFKFK